MTNEEQLAEIEKTHNKVLDFNSRQVEGGFILNGSVRYVNPATGGVAAQRQVERVCSSPDEAAKAYQSFCTNGTF